MEKFTRSGFGMQAHMEAAHHHLLGKPLVETVQVLRLSQPSPSSTLPALPEGLVPTYMLFCPPVSLVSQRAPSASQASTRTRRWKRMNTPKPEDDEEDSDEETTPLADIGPFVLGEDAVFRDYICLQKPPETFLQLSRPQPMVVPSVPEPAPPVSIGFEAFAARFNQLEPLDLIDGSGQWPPEDVVREVMEAGP